MKKTYWNDILLKNDKSLLGQDFQGGKWKPFCECADPQHRSVMGNEIFFDIDAEKWENCRKLAENLEMRLNSMKIPFLRFSSGNMLHYSVFFDDISCIPENSIFDAIVRNYFFHKKQNGKIIISISEMAEFVKKIKCGIFCYIVDGVDGCDGVEFDKAPNCASRHLVRLEGCLNEKTGFYKSFLPEFPNEQPKITEENIIFPEKIEEWKMPPEFFVIAYKKIIRPKKFENKIFGEIAWIEKILKTPQPDGRKRIIDLIIAPYLLNYRKIEPKEVYHVIYEWLKTSSELRTKTGIHSAKFLYEKNYVKEKIIYVKNSGLKPLKYENLDRHGLDFLS